ncbi:MAG: TIGR02281 family clan AA aspartic protease [Siculibacillus sp.]|nr:TIGR02281 family clan AA aspartic protease [Siculibacillus sp.]
MYRNALRLTLFGALAALMSPAWVPWLLHVVAFVTERPVAVDSRAVGYRVEESTGAPVRAPVGSGRRVTLKADSRGHFLTEAAINGRAISVMVDTGATSVALRHEDASTLGVRPPLPSDYTVPIATANGTARAARVVLSEVRIGDVRVRNVEALVMPERALGTNLLGMSFIKRLRNVELASGKLTFVE